MRQERVTPRAEPTVRGVRMAYLGWLPSARVGIYTQERSVRMRNRS